MNEPKEALGWEGREGSPNLGQSLSLLVAGHVVLDQIIDTPEQQLPRQELGGPISYSALTLGSLGHRCEVVTKVGYDFPSVYEKFLRFEAGVDVSGSVVPAFKTTSFKIDRTSTPRRMWLLARCKPLTMQDFLPYIAQAATRQTTLIINPVANEISLSLMERLSKEFEPVLVDSQGFIRQIPRDRPGEVRIKNGIDISSLSGVDVLKADSKELAGWTGSSDKERSIRLISKFVDVVLMSSGSGEVELYASGKLALRAEPLRVETNDTTGAGDILLASFASKFASKASLEESLAYSVAAASLSVRTRGVRKGLLDRDEVEMSAGQVRIQKM
ncbi:MAG TPA: PfkB family carbohydrate kinase [Nitrososphaerales archaeon]|nr:PfkB family carbohydrate kinase [Nitrososphaerales archaeon]